MHLLGLTGGVGMGKSACAQLLQDRDIPVVDTDELARHVVEPGQPALEEIRRAFGPGVIGPDGRLLRREMAHRVFPDSGARRQLEGVLHPRIRELWRTQAQVWRVEGRPLAVVVIPLLFETDAQAELDATVCVACSAVTQRERLLARGWTPEHLAQRLAAQWPAEKKMDRADYVIWTEGGLEIHALQLDRILSDVAGKA
jgi:dephospho-CoA kinase